MKPTADELLERYAEAAAQDASRPSAKVREAIRAHANLLAQARAATATEPPVAASPHAANQARWAVSLLASLAVVGLSTLLMLQIDRGNPEDREVAVGAPKPAHTAPEPAPAKPAAPPAPAPRADSVASMALDKAMAPAPAAQARAQLHQAASPMMQFWDAVRNGQIAIAEAFVQQGQSVNSRDENGDTALMVAVTYGQTGMVAKLLALGADRRLVNRHGFTAQDIARRLEFPNMVQLLQAPQ